MSKLEDELYAQIKGTSPVREFRFHPTRRWRFDMAYPERKLAVEVEGGTWKHKSRHTTGAGFEEDCIKYNEAALLGWTVLRVTGTMVGDGRAAEYVRRLLNER